MKKNILEVKLNMTGCPVEYKLYKGFDGFAMMQNESFIARQIEYYEGDIEAVANSYDAELIVDFEEEIGWHI